MKRICFLLPALALFAAGCANRDAGRGPSEFGKLSNGLECAIQASRTRFNPSEGTQISVYFRNPTAKPITVPPLYGRVTEPANARFQGYFRPGAWARLTVPRSNEPFRYPLERDFAVPPGEPIVVQPGATVRAFTFSFYDVYRLYGASRVYIHFTFDTNKGGFADGLSNILWLSIVHNLTPGSHYSPRLAVYAAEHVTVAEALTDAGACTMDRTGIIDCKGNRLRVLETLAGEPVTELGRLAYRIHKFRGERKIRKGERVIVFHSTLWVGRPVFKIVPGTRQSIAEVKRAIEKAGKHWGKPVHGLRAGITPGEGPFTTRNPPRFAFRVENVGDTTVYVVRSLIGSAQKLRYPYCTFEIKGPDGTIRGPHNPKIAARFRARRRKPVGSFAVKPGQKFDPYMYTGPAYKLPHLSFDKPGTYEVTFLYSTDSDDPEAWWSPKGKPLPKITRFTLRSNTVTVEVLPAR